jgi:hypothetical protein
MLRQIAEIYIAVYFRLREMIIILFKNGYDPDVKDIYSLTLLWLAA